MRAISLIVAWFAMLYAQPDFAAAIEPRSDDICPIMVAKVVNPPRFQDFPASSATITKVAPVRLGSSKARLFRTVLRDGVAKGPNFAGHYAVVVWGCGASCSDLALVDTKSGEVHFDSNARDIYTGHVEDEPDEVSVQFWAARFQLNSRLLIVVGMPNEDESRDGVTYFDWTGSRLKLLRFVPQKEACTPQH
jgi:hypothetical protein